MRHPARTITFTTLQQKLKQEVEKGNISEIQQGNLSLYCYTNRCVYNRLWNSWNVLARGLILDHSTQKVVATPFPKFFNYGEVSQTIPNDEPCEIYEKLDGSLGIAYYYEEQWHIATKGAFDSEQALWGTQQLRSLNKAYLEPGTTYLFEMVYANNKIVIKYPFEGLILLAAYDVNGNELSYLQLSELDTNLGINVVRKFDADSLKTILEKASNLDKNCEGFVLRFSSGFRLKIKGGEYCRIHKLISGVTPLGIWESLKNGDNLESIRQEIPEEYWKEFDLILQRLLKQFEQLVTEVETTHLELLDRSDKEIGLILSKLPEGARKFIFARRKNGEYWYQSPKFKEKLYYLIRPSDNCLIGDSESQPLRQVKLDN